MKELTEKISQNPELFSTLSLEIQTELIHLFSDKEKQDITFFRSLIAGYKDPLQKLYTTYNLPSVLLEEIKKDKSLLNSALTINLLPKTFESFIHFIHTDKYFALLALKRGWPYFNSLSPSLKSDQEWWLNVVSQDGLIIRYLSDELKNNVEIASAAVKNNITAIEHVGSALKKANKFFALTALSNNEYIIPSDELMKDPEVQLAFLKKINTLKKYWDSEFLADSALTPWESIADIPSMLWEDENFKKLAQQESPITFNCWKLKKHCQKEKNSEIIEEAIQFWIGIFGNLTSDSQYYDDEFLDRFSEKIVQKDPADTEKLRDKIAFLLLDYNIYSYDGFPENIIMQHLINQTRMLSTTLDIWKCAIKIPETVINHKKDFYQILANQHSLLSKACLLRKYFLKTPEEKESLTKLLEEKKTEKFPIKILTAELYLKGKLTAEQLNAITTGKIMAEQLKSIITLFPQIQKNHITFKSNRNFDIWMALEKLSPEIFKNENFYKNLDQIAEKLLWIKTKLKLTKEDSTDIVEYFKHKKDCSHPVAKIVQEYIEKNISSKEREGWIKEKLRPESKCIIS